MKAVRAVPKVPVRARDAHKGDCGRVLVVAGSSTMLGAAILCASAALRGGAGLVQVALPKALQPWLPLAVPAATTLSRSGAPWRLARQQAQAIVCGPGLGANASTAALVAELVVAARGEHGKAGPAVVLDADALNVLAPLRRPIGVRAVITPHPGEAARLLGISTAAVQGDRSAALAQLCQRSGAVVVLKGAGTLVGDGARCFTNRTGNAGMATGGSGDVLAGLLGALLAQGMDAFAAACLAVNVHGRAGDRVARRLSMPGLIASDLPLAIAEELQ